MSTSGNCLQQALTACTLCVCMHMHTCARGPRTPRQAILHRRHRQSAHAFMHMRTCAHAHMHTCAHAHMHTCTHAHMHMQMHTCTCRCTHTHMHTHMLTCTHAHMRPLRMRRKSSTENSLQGTGKPLDQARLVIQMAAASARDKMLVSGAGGA